MQQSRLSLWCLPLLIDSIQEPCWFCLHERQDNTWHWFTICSLKAFSSKDFCLWLNKVLMEGDKSVRLAQRDFLFHCQVKVICYMPQSRFPSTCDTYRIGHVEMPQNGLSGWWEWDEQSKHIGEESKSVTAKSNSNCNGWQVVLV